MMPPFKPAKQWSELIHVAGVILLYVLSWQLVAVCARATDNVVCARCVLL